METRAFAPRKHLHVGRFARLLSYVREASEYVESPVDTPKKKRLLGRA